jgi:arylsulfatase A-like enzyme
MCLWLFAVLGLMGCTESVKAPAQGANDQAPYAGRPFIRLAHLIPDTAPPEERIVRMGAEYRTVLSIPYRSTVKTTDSLRDGGGILVNVEDLSADALGIVVVRKTSSSVEYDLVPIARLRSANNQLTLDEAVNTAPTESTDEASVWVREVVPHREHVLTVQEVPPAAHLAFGIGLEESLSKTAMPVRFVLAADAGSERTVLFDETVSPRPIDDEGETKWQDFVLDVSEFAGQEVAFSFSSETIADSTPSSQIDTASALWADPVLYTTRPQSGRTTPNLLLVSLDTLRADHLGCYGYPRDTSPNLDRFAEECYLFEQCIAASSWTTPSHATAFTGLHPSVHGAGGFTNHRLDNRFTTLAEIAQEEHHLTAAYTEGVAVGGQLGFYQGFDRYSNGAGARPSPPGTSKRTFGDAASWLEQFGHLPFVMFVHTYEIHWPYEVLPPFDALFEEDAVGLSQMAIESGSSDEAKAQRQHVVNTYDRGIAFTDSVWGDFEERLREMGVLENTIVIVFSDHGEAFWEHGNMSHGKTLYNEVLHVPFLIRLPGQNPPHGRIDDLVSLADTFGTAVDFLGLNYRAPKDSYSLRTLMNQGNPVDTYDRMFVSSALQQRNMGTLMLTYQTANSKYIATTDRNHEQSPIYNFVPSTAFSGVAARDRATMAHLIDGGRDFWKAATDETRHEMYLSSREQLFDSTSDIEEGLDLVMFPQDKFNALDVPKKLHDVRTSLQDFLSYLATEYEGQLDAGNNTSPLTAEEIEELGALGYVFD